MGFYKKNRLKLARTQKILSEYDMPITLRQLYYQLVVRQFIENSDKAYNSLSRMCVKARDEGSLAEESFADRLREIDKLSSWDNLTSFLSTVRNAYQKDVWDTQDNYVEIWSEKDALRGVISEITHRYDVILLIIRGQLSRTAVWEGYQRFSNAVANGKNCNLFYFGDFDPSGIGIYRSLKKRLIDFKDGELEEHLNIERIALSEDQIAEYELPTIAAKKEDPNYPMFIKEYSDRAVELDALPPDVLRDMVENMIHSCLDNKKLKLARDMEKREKTKLKAMIDTIDIQLLNPCEGKPTGTRSRVGGRFPDLPALTRYFPQGGMRMDKKDVLKRRKEPTDLSIAQWNINHINSRLSEAEAEAKEKYGPDDSYRHLARTKVLKTIRSKGIFMDSFIRANWPAEYDFIVNSKFPYSWMENDPAICAMNRKNKPLMTILNCLQNMARKATNDEKKEMVVLSKETKHKTEKIEKDKDGKPNEIIRKWPVSCFRADADFYSQISKATNYPIALIKNYISALIRIEAVKVVDAQRHTHIFL